MDTKMLTAILVAGLVATMAGAGLYAYFVDVESSTGNTFAAGTFDLKTYDITPPDTGWKDGVTATWTLSNMKPGDGPVSGMVLLRNEGSIAADHLEIACDYIVTEESPQTESDTDPNTNLHPDSMAKQMVITKCEYYNDAWKINCLTGASTGTPPTPPGYVAGDWLISDTDGDTRITLYDLKHDPLDNLPPPDGDTHFEMEIKFYEGAGNDFQGDTLTLTVIFTLNQHSSQ